MDAWRDNELVLKIALALPTGGLPGLVYSYPLSGSARSRARVWPLAMCSRRAGGLDSGVARTR